MWCHPPARPQILEVALPSPHPSSPPWTDLQSGSFTGGSTLMAICPTTTYGRSTGHAQRRVRHSYAAEWSPCLRPARSVSWPPLWIRDRLYQPGSMSNHTSEPYPFVSSCASVSASVETHQHVVVFETCPNRVPTRFGRMARDEDSCQCVVRPTTTTSVLCKASSVLKLQVAPCGERCLGSCSCVSPSQDAGRVVVKRSVWRARGYL